MLELGEIYHAVSTGVRGLPMADYDIEQLCGNIRGTFSKCHNTASTGVVVLSGSSGRVDTLRANLFAEAGAHALALQWFGGVDQSPGICEIPIKTFIDAVDFLVSRGCRRIVFVGTSKGAEAALLASTIDRRVNVVIALSPTSVVWGNIGSGLDGTDWPERSSWSLDGVPLEFIPADLNWQKVYRDDLVSYRSFFETCLANDIEVNKRARIPIEKTCADLVLVAGGDDALWPSDKFAQELVQTRRAYGLSVEMIFEQYAGHRILLPGEVTARSKLHAHGGTDEADARLGQIAWDAISGLL
ncbi:hypothetical protein RRU01S_06_00830 [Agrobacterium rubi TR3 = NBRC 13261]|uniref:BAAT/Acyl-CoA thioester hydrolase C-terminal domain-containing protein n=3 Tax=Agrobacterium rubi TaxID=28099 RepID=A0A081CS29_9HYPH|nr:acyl-CoA thioester hydrolase/BAAT C-terminal domain-containing protein [Agrobacterium rubi]GAK69475.1 hypothetical protein RRU01S_06_00830 [Agrobacterium rubi TR3 = NBRC 13261]